MSVELQMHCPFNADFSPGTGKSQLETSQEIWGDASVFSNCYLLRNPWPKLTGVLSIVVVEKSTVGSPFSGAFPSDRIPKAAKNVNVHFFILSSNSCKLNQGLPGTFWSYCVFHSLTEGWRPIDTGLWEHINFSAQCSSWEAHNRPANQGISRILSLNRLFIATFTKLKPRTHAHTQTHT